MNNDIVTSSLLRKAVQHHKNHTPPACVFAIALGPTGTRFLGAEDTPRPNERAAYFDVCPVCGAKKEPK